MKSKLSTLLAAGILAGPMAANATAVVFNNEAAFQAATGASLANMPVGPSATLQSGFLQIGPTLELDVTSGLSGGVWEVFDQSHWVSCSASTHCLQGLADSISDPILGISDSEDFIIRSWDRTGGGPTPPLNPLYAFGFSLYEPISVALGGFSANYMCSVGSISQYPCAQSTFHIALQNHISVGTLAVASFDFSPGDDQWAFWGVQSDKPFNIISVSETTNGIENDYFSRFFYSTSYETEQPDIQVPEPGALALLSLGLMGMGAARQRWIARRQ